MYEINSFVSHHDCECCGSYSCHDVSVYDGSTELHKFEHESHFGGGNWSGDWLQVYAFILKDLGYKAVFSATLENMLESPEDDIHYYEQYKDEELIPLHVHVLYKRHYYKSHDGENSYDSPYLFSFSLFEETHKIQVTEYEKFYEECVKSIATVHENHESKSYMNEYDDY